MAAKKYLALISGRISEVIATVVSAGAADDGKIVALDATGKLDNSVMPVGIGADTKTVPASENLAAGELVNLWDDAGTLKARKADASASGKEADVFVLAAVTSGNNATVYFGGTNNQLSGLTAGSRYYLSATTPGAVTATPPTGSGVVSQYVGKATSATELSFEAAEGVVQA